MRSIELVVTDLDGTLWIDRTLHPRTRSALEELDLRGVPVLAATARNRRSARGAFERYGLALDAILLDGAFGECRDGETFCRTPFSKGEVASLVEIFRSFGHTRVRDR